MLARVLMRFDAYCYYGSILACRIKLRIIHTFKVAGIHVTSAFPLSRHYRAILKYESNDRLFG